MRKRKSSPLATLLAIVLLALVCFGLYAVNYHRPAPFPALEGPLKTVKYELSEGTSVPLLGDGFYIWSITNRNDFVWPEAWISFGEGRVVPLERVEPGEQKSFGNVLVANVNSGEMEALPLQKGESLTLTLYIDFTEETTLPARVRALLGMEMQWFDLGTLSRQG